ncbi:radical SAM protein [Candidatus Woesearchaeota archaeon]|nr:radical SAM protein [Candidatus Woesearchaeota archaeon]
MTKILIIYPPFCTPTSPPYSIFNLPAFIKANSDLSTKILDFNLFLHKKFIQNPFSDLSDYNKKAKNFFKKSGKLYKKINKNLRNKNRNLPLINEMIGKIKEYNPEFLVFTCIYNQQMIYASKIAEHFKKKTILGGPAATKKHNKSFDLVTNDLSEMLKFMGEKQTDNELRIEYDIIDINEYYSPKPILPVQSSIGCIYQKCAFCNFHGFKKYTEFPVKELLPLLKQNKYFEFIDDIVPIKRLAGFNKHLKDLCIRYMCYSRIEKNPTLENFKKIHESGCRVILWGVESGSDKILKLMNKGITTKNIKDTLEKSSHAGIKNIVYIIIGFPGETEKTLAQTITFLKQNKKNIHLVAPNIFSMQPESEVFQNPKKYRIQKIIPVKRSYLPKKYNYISRGLSHQDFVKLKEKYKKRFNSINSYAYMYSIYKDHFLLKVA